MSLAKYVSLQLARFERMRRAGDVEGELPQDVQFCRVGADWRASGSDFPAQEAFAFLELGRNWIEKMGRVLPWMGEAREDYGAVLQPYRHKGEVNFLNREEPFFLFEKLGEAVGSGEPSVAITSVGWKVGPELDMNRVREFGNGVAAVHKMQMEKYRMSDTADRTSFTRCRVVWSEGSWYGGDPMR